MCKMRNCENATQQHYFNAKPNPNLNYNPNPNPIVTDTPTNHNSNPSLITGGTALLQRSALLTMQTAVISVCPPVPFTFRCFVQTNENTIVRSTPSGTTIILVSGEVKLIRIFTGGHPSESVKVLPVGSENVTNNQPYNTIQYNTIQYKTCNAPYVTKMLFVGAWMTRD